MKYVGGYCFPDHDLDCHKTILGQTGDIKEVLKYVTDFSVCIQAGGNVGIWPSILAGYFETVYTFEPDQENFNCLLANTHGIKNIVSYQKALSDKIETVTVRPPNVAHKNNCGAYQVFEDENGSKTVRIDDLNLKPGLIYLDIEGYELKALQGAMETLKSRPVVCFEDKQLPFMYGKKVGDVENWLKEFGYEVAQKVHRDVICVSSS